MTPEAGRAAYRCLFRAHLLGIAATGIVTVAFALLAYDLAGSEAGAVLGTALALKMAVNVIALPLVAGLTMSLPTHGRLVRSMAARAGLLLFVPLIDSVWQIYVLVVLFQTASAIFVAVYLATVPELLSGDEDYARAVAKSKIAYDVESLVSPLLVAAALAFVGTREVFLIAALLLALGVPVLLSARFPPPRAPAEGSYRAYLGHVARLFAEPKLRGGLALTAAAIVIGAMVTVNTVVLVQGGFGLGERSAAIALAAYGAGGVAAALVVHRLIAGNAVQPVMLVSSTLMAGLLMAGAMLESYAALLVLWVALGITSTVSQLPYATLIRRTSEPAERQGLYAAQYSVSHAAQLFAYLSAGWIAVEGGMASAFLGLGLFSAIMVLLARAAWRPAAAPIR